MSDCFYPLSSDLDDYLDSFLWGNETTASRDICTATKSSLVEGACESNRND